MHISMSLHGAALTTLTAQKWRQKMTPYRSLGKNEVRLLTILPGKDQEPLHCSLSHYSLFDAESTHTTISYPWGPPEDPHHECLVDGFKFVVRDNAYSILSRLRRPSEAVKVWIDCLCIDQKNKAEKSAQIKLMHAIYKRAARTIIWLGRMEETNDEVVDFIRTLDVDRIAQEFPHGNWEAQWRYANKTFILDLLNDHPRKIFLVNGMARLFFAVYWSRVWIRQEAAVGGNPQLLWGRHEISWKHVAVLAWIFRTRTTFSWPDEYFNEVDYASAEYVTETILSIDSFRYHETPAELRGSTTTATPLFGQMVHARSGLTTKAHDKVYAITSLSSDIYEWERDKTGFLDPDYTLSWQEVYTEAAKFFFSKYYSASQVLDHAGIWYQGGSSDLPSWVPDWRYPILPRMVSTREAAWGAGGDGAHVQTKIASLSKKQRAQLLSYQGYASILPLCKPLPRDKCKATETAAYANLEPKEILPATHACADSSCKDKLSKAEFNYSESASRAACVLEIQSCMQDKIIYISRVSDWNTEAELSRYRHDILSIDAENLAFLEQQSTNRTDGLYITDQPLRKAYDWTLISAQDAESHLATETLVSTVDDWRAWLARDDIDHLRTPPPYHSAIESSFVFREYRFAYTRSGYMCLVPPLTELGDKVCIFNGYIMPFVIRPAVQDWNILLGQCYVHGMMTDKASELMDEFLVKVDDKSGKTIVKRPQGDVRANGLKMEAGRYVDILETLGKRWIKLI